jgi:hypothetical protein
MCPPVDAPQGNLRQEWESIFSNAFSNKNQQQCLLPDAIDYVENEVCGDALDAEFDGLHIWSNNVNTLSLNNDLADLHELCTIFKHQYIGIAALQELNIDLTQAYIYQKVNRGF